MKTIAAILFLCSCAVVDRLDGQIDDSENCCAMITEHAIRECVDSFIVDHRFECRRLRCTAPLPSPIFTPEGCEDPTTYVQPEEP